MDIGFWKLHLPAVFNGMCSEIRVEDAVVEWIDIIFEQVGNARGCPVHTHTWYEFNYVLSGQLLTDFGQGMRTIPQNSFFLIPPGMPHAHEYNRTSPHEGLCIRWRIRNASAEEEAVPAGTLSFYRQLESLQSWKPGANTDASVTGVLLDGFLKAAQEEETPRSLKLQLVRLLERLIFLHGSRKEERESVSTDPLLRKIEVYLEDTQGKVRVEKLADSLHLSYGHLARLYKAKTGITLVERMNILRLEKAALLLKEPEMRIKEAAERAGFFDPIYFSKAFKKHFGVNPRTFKKGMG